MDFSSKRPRVKRAWVIAGVTGVALIGGGTAAIAATTQGQDGPAAHVSVTPSAGPTGTATAAPARTSPAAMPTPSATASARPASPAPVPTTSPAPVPTATAAPTAAPEPVGDNDPGSEDNAASAPRPWRTAPVPSATQVPGTRQATARPSPTAR